MKLVVNVERSQLRGVLQELGANFADMEIVINNIGRGKEKGRISNLKKLPALSDELVAGRGY